MAQMKGCVALVLCVAIFSTPSLAETKQSQPPSSIQPGTTIQTLNKMCQENANSRPYTACVAYLRGLFDGMQQAKIVEDLKNTFCPPVTAETDQLRLIIEGWVRDNPKNLSVSVGWAVPVALSLAFPCPR
jgi:Rap1a immunity proteins